MKTNILSIYFAAGALAGGSCLCIAQDTAGQPNQVISGPSSENQSTTGGRITSAVENFLGRFLGNQPRSQLTVDQLPPAVQNAVRAEAGTASIQSIHQVNLNGQTEYLITFNRNGQDMALQIDPSGRILNRNQLGMTSSAGEPLSGSAPVQFYDLPAAVQSTLLQYSQGASINRIQRGTMLGQTIYEASIERNGRKTELMLDENGKLVNRSALASTGMGQSSSQLPDWRTAPVRQPLFGSSTVDFRSVPQAVRDAFLRYAGASGVENIEQGTIGGETVYQADLHPYGQSVALRVTATGALLNDQVNDRFLAQFTSEQNRNFAVGQAPNWQSGSGSSYGNSLLANSRSISFNQLPVAAQTTIAGQANGAPVDSITQGTLDGRTVYDVTYNQGGQPLTLRVAEDGSVLSRGGYR